MFDFWLQLAVVMCAIAIGGRFGGIGLGAAGGLGLAILTFVFGLKHGSAPVSIILIILAVITCVTILQVAGGLDLLVSIAEKILRKKPDSITFLGPLTIYIFTLICGTSYVAFSMYPVIAEIATDAKVRPERAMSMSVIASNMAIVASPMSAATAAMIAITSIIGTTPLKILAVTIPGCLLGCVVGCFFVYNRGLALEKDPEFLRRVKEGTFVLKNKESVQSEYKVTNKAKIALAIFLLSLVSIILMGSFPSLMPSWTTDSGVERMSIPVMLQVVMLATAALIMMLCRLDSEKLDSGSVFKAGLIGVIGVFGLSWMTGTFFDQYSYYLTEQFSGVLLNYPILFGTVLFAVSVVIYSPAATVASLMPLGVSMGIAPDILVGLLPAACATFIIPGGSQIACVAFDRTGTTKIGKYVVNHSYLLPGMVSLIASVVFCLIISKLIF